jgi:mono/diheme cytochrome c family protein
MATAPTTLPSLGRDLDRRYEQSTLHGWFGRPPCLRTRHAAIDPVRAISMPAFGNAYSDAEIAAVVNYVTSRFGTKPSQLTAQDVAELRKQTAR